MEAVYSQAVSPNPSVRVDPFPADCEVKGSDRAADIAGIPKKATQDSIGITENTLGILEGFQKK